MCKQIERVKVDGMVVGNSTTWSSGMHIEIICMMHFLFL
jgi:hypothetical protein